MKPLTDAYKRIIGPCWLWLLFSIRWHKMRSCLSKVKIEVISSSWRNGFPVPSISLLKCAHFWPPEYLKGLLFLFKGNDFSSVPTVYCLSHCTFPPALTKTLFWMSFQSWVAQVYILCLPLLMEWLWENWWKCSAAVHSYRTLVYIIPLFDGNDLCFCLDWIV